MRNLPHLTRAADCVLDDRLANPSVGSIPPTDKALERTSSRRRFEPAPQARRSRLQHHPIYVERESKEHPLLEDLVRRDPPIGGLHAYIASMGQPPLTNTPAHTTNAPVQALLLQARWE